MLFVLTGNIQTGKTRWLERTIYELRSKGITPYGVLAPGVWIDHRNNPEPSEHVDENGFEKIGIDNVMLPQQTCIRFAQRTDLATTSGDFNPQSQSAQAKLGWHIDEQAIKQVNAHLLQTAHELPLLNTSAILIIDELGQLELARNGGLTEAVSLLTKGPYPTTKHALIVVRESLLPLIEGKFDNWGETILISPDDASREAVLNAS